ncbi:potassium/proton antiporter [Oscillatoria laete-virens NRMC-F 0139]|nr:potassium/proton antiporter [Oscillatoria laete-virens]MDL5054514.1 potassium/proton antiporter [Oscillatoria laete-virens NRMC-F 0139]
MPYPIEFIILAGAVLVILGILANNISGRFGVPALLLSLIIGMLAGSDGPGGIWFDDAWEAQFVGTVALATILFAGGMETRWMEIKPLLVKGIALSTVGVLITALVVAAACHWIFGAELKLALLVGAIVSSTDAAAVFSVMNAAKVKLRGELKPLLEFESGSNDPMAIMLVIGVIEWIAHPNVTLVAFAAIFVKQLGLGLIFGLVLGRLLVSFLHGMKFDFSAMYPLLTIAAVFFIYGFTASLGGSGFLAVYIAGIMVGNSRFYMKEQVRSFSDALSWLMQILMFLILGLLVNPHELPAIAWEGLLLAVILIVVARPLAVFASMLFCGTKANEKLFISWVGLRGAVPIVLATYPLLAGVEYAHHIFNVVFFMVLISVLLQGTTIPLAARLCKVIR